MKTFIFTYAVLILYHYKSIDRIEVLKQYNFINLWSFISGCLLSNVFEVVLIYSSIMSYLYMHARSQNALLVYLFVWRCAKAQGLSLYYSVHSRCTVCTSSIIIRLNIKIPIATQTCPSVDW